MLVDSEPIVNAVLRDMLEAGGWAMTATECMRFFIGKAVRGERVATEGHTGQPLTEDTPVGTTAGVAAGAAACLTGSVLQPAPDMALPGLFRAWYTKLST